MQVGMWNGTIFEVSSQKVMTFGKYKKRVKHRYAEHKIHGGLTKLESVGVEASTVSLEVMLIRSLGVEVIEELRRLESGCRLGVESNLIIGVENLGEYVLESVEIEDTVYGYGGLLIEARAKLEFKEAGR